MSWGRVNIGSGNVKAYAIISVSYPSGSACTCSNGSKTLRAKGTSGNFIFLVPSSGTWTVAITDGSQTASTTVQISYEGQIESVTINYTLYLINGATVNYPFTCSLGSLSPNSNWTQFYYSGGAYAFIARLTNPIDISHYSKLKITVANGKSWSDNSGNIYCPAIIYGKNAPTINSNSGAVSNADGFTRLTVTNHNITAGTYTLNIPSGLTNNQYIAVTCSGDNGYNGYMNIEKLWLE